VPVGLIAPGGANVLTPLGETCWAEAEPTTAIVTQAKSASLFISPSLDDDRLTCAPMIYTEDGRKSKREVRTAGATPQCVRRGARPMSNFRPQH
jgi:hypothetical protein